MKKLFIVLSMVGVLFASVDINNASQKELMSIKGVGKKKAEAIIAYRKSHCFKSIDELVKVKGIGKKFVQKHRSELSAGACKK